MFMKGTLWIIQCYSVLAGPLGITCDLIWSIRGLLQALWFPIRNSPFLPVSFIRSLRAALENMPSKCQVPEQAIQMRVLRSTVLILMVYITKTCRRYKPRLCNTSPVRRMRSLDKGSILRVEWHFVVWIGHDYRYARKPWNNKVS